MAPPNPDEAAFYALFGQTPDADIRFVAHRPDSRGSLSQRIYSYEKAPTEILRAMYDGRMNGEAAFPFVYNARHALELLLKHTLWRSVNTGLLEESALQGNDPRENVMRNMWRKHDLRWLAARVECALEKLGGEEYVDQWRPSRELLEQWEVADPDGAFFRYSRDNEGNPLHARSNVYCGGIFEPWRSAMAFLHHVNDMMDDAREAISEYERETEQYAAEAARDYGE